MCKWFDDLLHNTRPKTGIFVAFGIWRLHLRAYRNIEQVLAQWLGNGCSI